MHVLLVSPLNPRGFVKKSKLRFLNGESTYTEALLKNPPKGVEYTFYSDALKKGWIKHTLWQKPLNWLIKFRVLPLSPQIICFKLRKNFDLVHSLGHGLKISGNHPPVVLADSSGNYQMVKGYMGWGEARIKVTYLIKRFVVKFLKLYDQELNIKDARLIVWSEASKKDHIRFGIKENRIITIPPGLHKPLKMRKKIPSLFNILFIGTWFERKGGNILLKVYEQLVKRYPGISLTIVTNIPSNTKLPENTYHRDFLPRKEIFESLYPKGSVLVLVPPKAEGFGLTVLEAASFGIPAIVSRVYALPEVVEDGKNGFLIKPGSIKELEKALEKLITNPELTAKMGREAKKKFLKHFWIKQTNKKLFKVYKEAFYNSKHRL
ncbi:glycosyltransferase family 4 protein [Candidatus Daviesbacteria bacterium]|nr:glycosyltransferase family 4 protein [Candidatus Daviesbacteria bacterium]